jgi:sugar phosphate isomerase/epimerase
MNNRRAFLQTTGLAIAGSVAGIYANQPTGIATSTPPTAPKLLDRIGIGLFTIPKLLEQDFAATMKMLAEIGYKEIEFYGPYSFSAPAAQERWKAVSASVGFSGSGYFGRTAAQVKEILARNGLTTPSMHTDLHTLRTRMSELAAAAHTVGHRYVVLPSIPDEERRTLDGHKKIADEFNQIGASAAKAGLRFTYHNHGYGLVEMEGRIPLRLILERTDPKLVDFQMDIYWTTAGGADPIAYLKEHPNRYRSMHVKDMAKKMRFSGDGGDSKQWIALFPNINDAGSGVLDLRAILTQARQSGDGRRAAADDWRVFAIAARGLRGSGVSFERRHDLLRRGRRGQQSGRRANVPLAAARCFRRAQLASGRAPRNE